MRLFTSIIVALVTAAGPTIAQDNNGQGSVALGEQLTGIEAVGRIDVSGDGSCTGALIASDLVLTAGHCVLEPDGTPVAAERLMFQAGLADGTAVAVSRVLRTVVPPGFSGTAPLPPEEMRLNLALLQLETPIPAALVAPFVVQSPAEGDAVSVVSYADGQAEALSLLQACSVLGNREGLIALDCDVSFGSSGAPVLDGSTGLARMVSFISSGSAEGGPAMAIGMDLPGVVSQLTAMLQDGKALSEAAEVPPEPRMLGGDGQDRDIGARFVKP